MDKQIPPTKVEHMDKQIPPIEVVTLVEKRALVHPGLAH